MGERMKIAVWDTWINRRGSGMEIAALAMLTELKKLNYEIHIFSQMDFHNKDFTTELPVTYLSKKNFSLFSLSNIKASLKFRKEIKKYSPDVILFVGALWFFFIRIFLFGLKKRTIVWEHLNYNSHYKRKYLKILARQIAARKADRLVVLTERAKELYQNNCACKIEPIVIPNFIRADIDHINTKSLRSRKKQIVFSGRYEEEKQIDKLIDIWKKVEKIQQEWTLILLGTGTLFSEIERKLQKKHIQNIQLLGFQKDPGKYYTDSQIMVLTSREEGLPLVLIEGLFTDLPIVSFDCDCGPADIIDDGKNGFLIPCYDEDLFAQRLLQLMKDDHLREQFACHAREKRKQFLPEAVMPLWNSLLEEFRN